ncbi:MAG: hypothetical protein K2X27_11530 [Candidatus Obscuribacterales bacterium]|nr:hypothetical protein [Candidatus Obscuribacterales bacterium]
MNKIAVIGASRGIGLRAVEILHLNAICSPRVIVAAIADSFPVSKFDLQLKLCNFLDENSLVSAFENIDSLLLCQEALNDPQELDCIFNSARKAKVKRIVYMCSSFEEELGSELHELFRRQIQDYEKSSRLNNKIRSLLLSKVHCLTVLSTYIVYGPHCERWTGHLADLLLRGEFGLWQNGEAKSNAVYVDNLVYAALTVLSADEKKIRGKRFFVSDIEKPSWKQLIVPIAEALDLSPDAIPSIDSFQFARVSASKRLLSSLKTSVPANLIKRHLPQRFKLKLQKFFSVYAVAKEERESGFEAVLNRKVALDQDSLFYQAVSKDLDSGKLTELDYQQKVCFEDAVRRSISWLSFLSYSVNR